eukprot:3154401-Pleurochrysis_carterae.AAC.6
MCFRAVAKLAPAQDAFISSSAAADSELFTLRSESRSWQGCTRCVCLTRLFTFLLKGPLNGRWSPYFESCLYGHENATNSFLVLAAGHDSHSAPLFYP